MAAEKIESIILSVAPYRETSCILRLFTREYGLVHGIAKGIRGNVKASQIDRGFLIEALLYYKPNRELHTLGSPHIVNYFPLIRSDITKSAIRDVALEIYLKTIHQSEPHPELFELMVDFFYNIEKSSEIIFQLLWRFICQYCVLMGFGMDAKSYRMCGIDDALIRFIEDTDDGPPRRYRSGECLDITDSLLQYCRAHFDIRAAFKSFDFVKSMY